MRKAPPETRRIRIRLISTHNSGSNNDGYYDGLSLQAIGADAVGSGIKFVGRSAEDQPPVSLSVYESGNESALARLDSQWGELWFLPGVYQVRIRPTESFAEPIVWDEVEVHPREMTEVAIESGLDVSVSEQVIAELESWCLYAADREQPLMKAKGEEGFTPLPPGRYELRIKPGKFGEEQVPWAKVEVKAGEVAELSINSGIRLTGCDEHDRPPEYWYVYKSGSDDCLTWIEQSWGFTPLPPGVYTIETTYKGAAG